MFNNLEDLEKYIENNDNKYYVTRFADSYHAIVYTNNKNKIQKLYQTKYPYEVRKIISEFKNVRELTFFEFERMFKKSFMKILVDNN